MKFKFKLAISTMTLCFSFTAEAYQTTEQYYLVNYLRNDAGLVSSSNIQELGFSGADDKKFYKIDYEYNTLGKVSKEIYYQDSWTAPHHSITFGYDGAGRVISKTDGTSSWSYVYDAIGNLRKETDPNQVVTLYEYDALGGVSRVEKLGQITQYTYDGFGQRTSEISPATGTTVYTYDALGNLDIITYADGSSQDYDYDSEGRLTSIKRSDSPTKTVFNYHATSGLLSSVTGVTNGDSFSKSYTYDGFGRIKSQSAVVGGMTRTTRFDYNPGDNTLSRITYPSGRKAEYFYEHPILRTATKVDLVNGSSRQTLVKDVNYGNNGILEAYTLRSGKVFSQSYNLSMQQNSQKVGTVMDVSYTFDSRGRVNGVWDTKAAANTKRFTYDSLDALNSVRSSSNAILKQYSYNGNLDRTYESGSGSAITPVYNADKKLTRYGTRDFTYNNRGNMSAWESSTGVTSQIGYDTRGLSTSYQTGGSTSYLDRDESGALIMVKRGAYQDHYSFAGSQLLHERNGQTNKQTDYIYLNGQLVGVYDGALSNVITGHLGQPQAMFSESGAQVWRGFVEGFDINITTQTRTLKARFPGQYDILGNGLYYNYFRDYDPKLGRYVQSDPIGLAGGLNTYGYVGGNPLMYSDPTGEKYGSALVCGGTVFAIATLSDMYNLDQGSDDLRENLIHMLNVVEEQMYECDATPDGYIKWEQLRKIREGILRQLSEQGLFGIDGGTFVIGAVGAGLAAVACSALAPTGL